MSIMVCAYKYKIDVLVRKKLICGSIMLRFWKVDRTMLSFLDTFLPCLLALRPVARTRKLSNQDLEGRKVGESI